VLLYFGVAVYIFLYFIFKFDDADYLKLKKILEQGNVGFLLGWGYIPTLV